MCDIHFDDNIIHIAENIISKYRICDYCLGRLFTKIQDRFTNEEYGKKLREFCKIFNKISIDKCWLCKGLVGEIGKFTDLISESIKEFEFDTFLIGVKIDDEIEKNEQELMDLSLHEYSESIKSDIKKKIGKKLENKLNKEVDFKDPTIMAIIDTSFDVVSLQIKSLMIYGRYKKFKRNIPQTKWFCRICRGKGCRRCNYTGKIYDISVEELISEQLLKITSSIDESFHGCGREDIDALMLGNGRPFILELIRPKIRNIDLKIIEKKINDATKNIICVKKLNFSNEEEIKRIKNARFRKKYRVMLTGEKELNIEKFKKVVESLHGKTISQFTPSRVARRRSNIFRERKIYKCILESIAGYEAILIIEAESGTYIKELVSGDDGKTNPNISDIIGISCKVKKLDVIEIKGE